MMKLTTGALVAAVVVAVPAGAVAAPDARRPRRGPDRRPRRTGTPRIQTQVHSWSRDGSTTVRLMVNGLAAGRDVRRPRAHQALRRAGHRLGRALPALDRSGGAPRPARGVARHHARRARAGGQHRPRCPGSSRPARRARSSSTRCRPTRPPGSAGARLACTTVTLRRVGAQSSISWSQAVSIQLSNLRPTSRRTPTSREPAGPVQGEAGVVGQRDEGDGGVHAVVGAVAGAASSYNRRPSPCPRASAAR